MTGTFVPQESRLNVVATEHDVVYVQVGMQGPSNAAPAETVSTIGALISGATAKSSPVNADSVGLSDSEASGVLKTTYFEGRFNQQTRVLELKFSQKKIAKLDDGRTFEDPIPQELRVVLSDPDRKIPLLNRRTGLPTGGDITAGRLTQAIASLFVFEQNTAEVAAAAAAAAAEQPLEGHDLAA